MSLFEKFKKKKVVIPQPQPNTGVIVLFDKSNIDINEFETAISEKFGMASILQIDKSSSSCTHLMLCVDGMQVMCSYMPFSLPEEEANIPSLLNSNHYISEEEQVAFVENKSFCLLTEIGGGQTLAGKRAVCLMLTKLSGKLLSMDSAIGIYYSPANLLIGKIVYEKYVSIMEREVRNPDYFPVVLWVSVYSTRADDGASTIETCGLEQFGFCELAFYEPTEEWSQSYEKLYIMSVLQITEKEVYKNMDTITFTQDTVSIFKQSGKKLVVIGGI